MKYQVYTLRDLAAEVFGRPIFARARGELLRELGGEVNKRGDSHLFQHPDDFDLFYLGLFDDHDGSFALGSPERVCNCRSLVVVADAS